MGRTGPVTPVRPTPHFGTMHDTPKTPPAAGQADPAADPSHRRTMSTRTQIILGLVLGLSAAAAGVYFGTDWFRKSRVITEPPEIGRNVERKAVPVPKSTFTNVTEAAGIRFVHFNGSAGKKLLPETMGGGVCV